LPLICHDELATRHDKCIDSRAVIDRASSEPLHAQLRQTILDAIADGRWRPGDRLPSETELCRQFDISRTTVRQALTMLELEGALRREQGRGTFVAEPAPTTGFLQSSAGFQEDAERGGHVVTSQVLNVGVERMPSWAAAGLDREPDTHGVSIERVRSLDGQVVMYADTWILLDFAEGVLAADLSRESLYHVLHERHGVVVHEGRRSVQAVVAEPRVAQLLEVPEGSPVLHVEAITSDRDGRPFECYRAWHRTDRSRLEIRVEGG
jgi:GntR family transcriptional regulator